MDERRRTGEKSAQFLLLGSASPELLRQSSETLAGRISYLEMYPLTLTEVTTTDAGAGHMDHHWFRGEYPESFLAQTIPPRPIGAMTFSPATVGQAACTLRAV